MNGDVNSDQATLSLKSGEYLEDFHRNIIRLQQEIILSGETVSTTRFIFQYMKSLSKIYKLKSFIATRMKDLITFLEESGK